MTPGRPVAALVVLALAAACAGRPPQPAAAPRASLALRPPGRGASWHDPGTAERLRSECGIEVVRLAPTAGGAMLELRYLVVDLERAQSWAQRPLALELDGSALGIPSAGRLGSLWTKPRVEGKLHYALFQTAAVPADSRFVLIVGGRRYEGLRPG